MIAEFEARTAVEDRTGPDIFATVFADIGKLQKTRSVREFLNLAVTQIREFTGFDRVMVYKFHEDGSGEVSAESVADGLDSFLGLHYPASDIPLPARRLFKLTWLRHQPDIGYKPSRVIPATDPDTGLQLDLSYALLRSVSVMYSQYLVNMGTKASMVLTLLRNGELWGLIACHHHTGPRHVPLEIRSACESLAHIVSLQLSDNEEREEYQYRGRMQAAHAQILSDLAVSNDVAGALIDVRPGLRDFIDSGGVAVVLQGIPVMIGSTPEKEQVQRLVEFLAKRSDGVFASDCLSVVHAEAAEYSGRGSGVLAIRIGSDHDDYILWFRPEFLRTVSWAGDPRKPVDISDDGQRLLPRTSFAIWKETVRRKSLPWKQVEVDAAGRLREAIREISARRAGELQTLYRNLQQTNVELNAFAYIASHDLKSLARYPQLHAIPS